LCSRQDGNDYFDDLQGMAILVERDERTMGASNGERFPDFDSAPVHPWDAITKKSAKWQILELPDSKNVGVFVDDMYHGCCFGRSSAPHQTKLFGAVCP
jgi:hypothetical protein